MIRSAEDDRQYRRGMVLGLTMAEIMLLLIFLLLLVLAILLAVEKKHVREAERRAADIAKEEADVRKDRDQLREQLNQVQLADRKKYDLTKEYQKIKAERDELKTREDEAKSAMEVLEEIKAGRKDLDNAKAAVEMKRLIVMAHRIEQQTSALAPNDTSEEAMAKFEKAAAIGAEVLASGGTATDLLAKVAMCEQEAKQCEANYSELARVTRNSSGTKPSCWVDPETKKAQMLFIAKLSDGGIYLEPTDIPSRASEREALPLEELKVGVAYERKTFSRAGRKIYDWAESQDPPCRFYVDIEDDTGADQKERFQELFFGVQDVFYTRGY
jgi:hypothetical protein